MKERRRLPDSRRKLRERPTPRWLLADGKIDETARQRCLLILSVLSGVLPVTEAVKQARISRPNYYLLETRAIRAMLQSLAPGTEEPGGTSQAEKISDLEKKVSRLEQEKRRAERLLLLANRILPPDRKTERPTKKVSPRHSTKAGRRPSSGSKDGSPSSPPEKSEIPMIGGVVLP